MKKLKHSFLLQKVNNKSSKLIKNLFILSISLAFFHQTKAQTAISNTGNLNAKGKTIINIPVRSFPALKLCLWSITYRILICNQH